MEQLAKERLKVAKKYSNLVKKCKTLEETKKATEESLKTTRAELPEVEKEMKRLASVVAEGTNAVNGPRTSSGGRGSGTNSTRNVDTIRPSLNRRQSDAPGGSRNIRPVPVASTSALQTVRREGPNTGRGSQGGEAGTNPRRKRAAPSESESESE